MYYSLHFHCNSGCTNAPQCSVYKYSACLAFPSYTKFLKLLIFPSPRVFCLTAPSEHDPSLLYTWQRPEQYTRSHSTVKRVPKTAVWRTCHLWKLAMSWERWACTNIGHLSGFCPRICTWCTIEGSPTFGQALCPDVLFHHGSFKDGPYLTDIVCHFMSPRSSQQCVTA